MSTSGLSSGDKVLIDAAVNYFSNRHQQPVIHLSSPVSKDLGWTPSLHFRAHEHLTVIGEVSETPYPLIFQLRRTELLALSMPASVYAICPEESYLKNQPEFKRLTADGFGLLTVDLERTVQRRAATIPLIQQITETEFEGDIRGLPKKLRSKLADAFDAYKHNAPSGAAEIAEVMEGLVLKAGREAAQKGWIANADAKAGATAKILSAMQQSVQCRNAAAALGAAQGFISMYRNLSHHFPKDSRQAAKKYRDCRHGFLEGLKKVAFFRDQMRHLGLSGVL